MTFTYIDGALVVDLNAEADSSPMETTIINNTANTWQPDRSLDEIKRDTRQGKMAEAVMEQYFAEFSDDFRCITYDEIRKDGGNKHAPFDEMLAKKGMEPLLLKDCIDRILHDLANNEFGKISADTRALCRKRQVYLVEIKSSKINDRLMQSAGAQYGSLEFQKALIDSIRKQRSIWIYPRYVRDSNEITDYEDYARHVYNPKEFGAVGYEYFKNRVLPHLEVQEASDIRVQVFVEYEGEEPARCYVMGYALCCDIAKNKTIQKFHSRKSEQALYMTLPLTKSRRIANLFCDERLWNGR